MIGETTARINDQVLKELKVESLGAGVHGVQDFVIFRNNCDKKRFED